MWISYHCKVKIGGGSYSDLVRFHLFFLQESRACQSEICRPGVYWPFGVKTAGVETHSERPCSSPAQDVGSLCDRTFPVPEGKCHFVVKDGKLRHREIRTFFFLKSNLYIHITWAIHELFMNMGSHSANLAQAPSLCHSFKMYSQYTSAQFYHLVFISLCISRQRDQQ